MARTKFKFVVFDVATDLRQVFADRKIQFSQVAYWATLVANKLLGQHIQKRDSGSFLFPFDSVPLEEDPKFFGRKFITLPGSIFDFDKDKGVNYITYTSDGQDLCPPRFTRVTFNRTTVKASHRLYLSGYETPGPHSPYYYLSSGKIWFLGLEKIDVPFLEMGLFLHVPPVDELGLNDEFPFPDELISQLKREVIDLGRFALLLPNQDRKNDGTFTQTEKVPTQKIAAGQAQQQAE